ncbi:MAG: Glutaredoxin-like protein, YruB-family [Parcubacteria group bacterium GW2011_GWA2_46_10]|nr:MAG: Glutaredoxin-like protein, YruB-family [Microgenomates group bacterium GW2011_GWA1_Microgenomates_45_10]KKU19464.1 MAG: Glutaredoxin-like protein, YruB-family [Parcubacteria group bacterium GW2011_GWA2_46_10]
MAMNIKMYSTPFCKYCKLAKEIFNKKNLSFEEIDITQNQKLMEEMLKKSNEMTVPVFDINGQILVGFNRTKLEEALVKVA